MTRGERTRRGFRRLAIVGAAPAFVIGVFWLAVFLYHSILPPTPEATRLGYDLVLNHSGEGMVVFLGFAIAWLAGCLSLGWIISGFMD